MSDPDAGGRDSSTGQPSTGDDRKLDARLEALGEELKARGITDEPAAADSGARSRDSGQGRAWRLATEFVAGILVGGAIGWFFDSWLGTTPWGLIVFLMLGFAAGVLNALRTAGLVRESPVRTRRDDS
jgi:ATP synthase protein I